MTFLVYCARVKIVKLKKGEVMFFMNYFAFKNISSKLDSESKKRINKKLLIAIAIGILIATASMFF